LRCNEQWQKGWCYTFRHDHFVGIGLNGVVFADSGCVLILPWLHVSLLLILSFYLSTKFDIFQGEPLFFEHRHLQKKHVHDGMRYRSSTNASMYPYGRGGTAGMLGDHCWHVGGPLLECWGNHSWIVKGNFLYCLSKLQYLKYIVVLAQLSMSSAVIVPFCPHMLVLSFHVYFTDRGATYGFLG